MYTQLKNSFSLVLVALVLFAIGPETISANDGGIVVEGRADDVRIQAELKWLQEQKLDRNIEGLIQEEDTGTDDSLAVTAYKQRITIDRCVALIESMVKTAVVREKMRVKAEERAAEALRKVESAQISVDAAKLVLKVRSELWEKERSEYKATVAALTSRIGELEQRIDGMQAAAAARASSEDDVAEDGAAIPKAEQSEITDEAQKAEAAEETPASAVVSKKIKTVPKIDPEHLGDKVPAKPLYSAAIAPTLFGASRREGRQIKEPRDFQNWRFNDRGAFNHYIPPLNSRPRATGISALYPTTRKGNAAKATTPQRASALPEPMADTIRKDVGYEEAGGLLIRSWLSTAFMLGMGGLFILVCAGPLIVRLASIDVKAQRRFNRRMEVSISMQGCGVTRRGVDGSDDWWPEPEVESTVCTERPAAAVESAEEIITDRAGTMVVMTVCARDGEHHQERRAHGAEQSAVVSAAKPAPS
jgi:hypothetical protein